MDVRRREIVEGLIVVERKQLLLDCIELRADCWDGSSGVKSSDHFEAIPLDGAREGCCVEGGRPPDLRRRLIRTRRKGEAPGHDADDNYRRFIDADGLAEDPRIGMKL